MDNRLTLYVCKLSTTQINTASRPIGTVIFWRRSPNFGKSVNELIDIIWILCTPRSPKTCETIKCIWILQIQLKSGPDWLKEELRANFEKATSFGRPFQWVKVMSCNISCHMNSFVVASRNFDFELPSTRSLFSWCLKISNYINSLCLFYVEFC